ncbi:hypothetical protein DFJ73DRAFT_821665 [Zopfochytrium polystomum]|nr:hypothetical protein DFJ73DRAFT_821665 [Zopfochytrium polystomum]
MTTTTTDLCSSPTTPSPLQPQPPSPSSSLCAIAITPTPTPTTTTTTTTTTTATHGSQTTSFSAAPSSCIPSLPSPAASIPPAAPSCPFAPRGIAKESDTAVAARLGPVGPPAIIASPITSSPSVLPFGASASPSRRRPADPPRQVIETTQFFLVFPTSSDHTSLGPSGDNSAPPSSPTKRTRFDNPPTPGSSAPASPQKPVRPSFFTIPPPEPRMRMELYEDACRCPKTTLEASAHSAGRHLSRELALVFSHYDEVCRARSWGPALGRSLLKDALIVPTMQRTVTDIMAVNPDTNWERNLLLEYFFMWAHEVCEFIHRTGHWADFTDPASGYPVYTPRGTTLYPDVDGSSRLLRYVTQDVGCCRVLSHPKWGSRNYPATLFTTAPVELLQQALDFARHQFS